jgi:hypothetical protein
MPETEMPVSTAAACRIVGLGATKMAAIKRAMGVAYSHTVFVSQVVAFLQENPSFRVSGQPATSPKPGKSVRPQRKEACDKAD